MSARALGKRLAQYILFRGGPGRDIAPQRDNGTTRRRAAREGSSPARRPTSLPPRPRGGPFLLSPVVSALRHVRGASASPRASVGVRAAPGSVSVLRLRSRLRGQPSLVLCQLHVRARKVLRHRTEFRRQQSLGVAREYAPARLRLRRASCPPRAASEAAAASTAAAARRPRPLRARQPPLLLASAAAARAPPPRARVWWRRREGSPPSRLSPLASTPPPSRVVAPTPPIQREARRSPALIEARGRALGRSVP